MAHPVAPPPPPARPGSDGRAAQLVLAVLGGLLVVLSGLVTTAVLLLSVGPWAYAVGLVAAALPVGPLLAVYRWLDRYEPEPGGLLLFGFGWGAAVATAAALLLSLPPTLAAQAAGGDPELVGAVLVAPVVEEAVKGLGLLAVLLVGRRGLDGLVDGVVYAGMIGIGFAFTENILYLGTALLDGGGAGLLATFVLRGVVSPFAHPLFTAATGVGLVLASRRRGAARVRTALLGLLVAVLLHGGWNAAASGLVGGGFLLTFVVLWVPLFAATVGLAVVARVREARIIRSGVDLYAGYGWFTPAEAQTLASLPLRRRSVQQARSRAARRDVRAFQATAARLAHLRHRIAAGTEPGDAARRERELLDRLLELRARS